MSTTDVARAAGVARGLINHYFGTKKDLYLEVVRVMLTIPEVAVAAAAGGRPAAPGSTPASPGSSTWSPGTAPRGWRRSPPAGWAGDADVERVLAEAEDAAADRVLVAVGLAGAAEHREELRGMVRAYVGLATSTAREWLQRGALTRAQVHLLLATTLLAIVEQVFPTIVTPAPLSLVAPVNNLLPFRT